MFDVGDRVRLTTVTATAPEGSHVGQEGVVKRVAGAHTRDAARSMIARTKNPRLHLHFVKWDDGDLSWHQGLALELVGRKVEHGRRAA